ncbi:hypothetical protein [Streptomyces sp. NPDC048419]|uniref:hypothetical protein n=1 Tax=Streptomyces sp. NPDC048419 TaxID=3365547 RepID=UPI0037239E6E
MSSVLRVAWKPCNEQLPSSGAGAGLKVNGVHFVLPADGGAVVLASTDSAMHNCGD